MNKEIIFSNQSMNIELAMGCCRGRCRFCTDCGKTFRVFSLAEVKENIDSINTGSFVTQAVFSNEDSIAFPASFIIEVMNYIKEKKPQITEFAICAKTQAILMKPAEELMLLRDNGLTKIYHKIISGDQSVLDDNLADENLDEQIEAAELIKKAGIKLSQIIYTGLAKKYMNSHVLSAILTAKHLNMMQPDEVISAPYCANPLDSLEEIKSITESLFLENGYFSSGEFKFKFPEQKNYFSAFLFETMHGSGVYLNQFQGAF
ncbi:MAG: radical SAM protein [Spirochaetes bacterium]|nr:radical SAM protein [Spirochaetota bacterium]